MPIIRFTENYTFDLAPLLSGFCSHQAVPSTRIQAFVRLKHYTLNSPSLMESQEVFLLCVSPSNLVLHPPSCPDKRGATTHQPQNTPYPQRVGFIHPKHHSLPLHIIKPNANWASLSAMWLSYLDLPHTGWLRTYGPLAYAKTPNLTKKSLLTPNK